MREIAPDRLASVVVALFFAAMAGRYLLVGYPRWRVVARVTVFVGLTLVLRAYAIVPFEVSPPGNPGRRVFAVALEIAWWFVGAQLVRATLRTALQLGSPRRETILLQELLGALVYVIAAVGICTYVLDLPIRGLLATSGALAIVVGLALQSSLGDAFSGVVLNLERPYSVGDWISVDGAVEGYVLETNWRTTHIRTPSSDLAVVPNSVIAKSKIVNGSQPSRVHRSGICVRLDRTLALEDAQDLMKDVLRGCVSVLHSEEPSVTLKSVSSEAATYELRFAVAEIGSVDVAKAEILRRAVCATAIAGGSFAPEFPQHVRCETCTRSRSSRGLLEAIPLFGMLTAAERDGLLTAVVCRTHRAGTVVASQGVLMDVLVIVRQGVLVLREQVGEDAVESARFTPGQYFGERGLLAGARLAGTVTAMTHAITYEIAKDALAPVFKARPMIVDQLGEALERGEQARQGVLSQHKDAPLLRPSIGARVGDTIRRLFAVQWD